MTVDALGAATPPPVTDRRRRGRHCGYARRLFVRFCLILFLELHVKTVKYFKSIEFVQEQVEKAKKQLEDKGEEGVQVGSME